jgi:hypothetical protein
MKKNQSQRGLSETFLENLLSGYLKPILECVKKDDTLFLGIRENYINIYYRGGSLLKLSELKEGYSSEFNSNYFQDEKNASGNKKFNIAKIKDKKSAETLVAQFPFLKMLMDNYFSTHRNNEREFQQITAKENNNSIISNDTDYFITDIEYTSSSSKEARFDMVAIKWESSSKERKNSKNCTLSLIEMKYGDGAIEGKSGIENHLKHFSKFCNNKENIENLSNETLTCFNQLRKLELIKFGKNGNSNQIDSLSTNPMEYILILANHKPAKSKLNAILDKCKASDKFEIKIATSSFMGYGLYKNNIIPLKEFLLKK